MGDINESNIKLTDKYYLCRDTYNMWIMEKVQIKNKDGKVKDSFRIVGGYHNNFQTLLKAFYEARTITVEARTVIELLKKMSKIQADMELIVKALCKQYEGRDDLSELQF